MYTSKGKNRILLFVLIPFTISCLIISIITPPFEAPDENHHLDYINYFSTNLSLPNQSHGNSRVEGEGHQNPMYYIITGAFIKLASDNDKVDFLLVPNEKHIWNGGTEWRTTVFNHSQSVFSNNDEILFHILRGFSTIFSIITLFFLFKTTYLFTMDLRVSLMSVLLISTLPQFVFISSVINNDSLAIMFITMSFYFLLKYQKKIRWKKYLYIAVWAFIMAFYTKLYSAGIIFIFFLFLLTNEEEQKLSRNNIKKAALVSLAIIILISPWLIRNVVIYGSVLGSQSFLYGKKTIFDLNISELFSQIAFLGTSFIGRFGWANITLHILHYTFYLIIFLIVFYGLLLGIKNANKYVFLSLLGIIITFLQIIYYGSIDLQFQGRYLFPAIIFFVLIITNSFKSLINLFPVLQKRSVFVGVVIGLYIQNIVTLLTLWSEYH